MEDVEFPSPFKSPSVTDLPRRVRACSASPVLSVEKDAVSPPFRSQNFYGPSSRASSEGRDENETLTGAPGDHVRVNPFEKDILAGLQKSFWSPSILDIQDTPPQRTWAIEHISQLFPKDIENSPSTHQNSFPVDAQAEAKAQADIDVYVNYLLTLKFHFSFTWKWTSVVPVNHNCKTKCCNIWFELLLQIF